MLMSRWQPYTDLWGKMSQFRDEMDRLFESFSLGGGGWPTLAAAYPAVNVWEDGDHIYAEAELPGMELNDLEIYVAGGNQLTVKGERKSAVEEEKGGRSYREVSYGAFERTVALPWDVDAEQVKAACKDGVLEITMKAPEKVGAKKINVVH